MSSRTHDLLIVIATPYCYVSKRPLMSGGGAWWYAAEMKDCDYDVTSELLVATSSNDNDDAYRREVQLQVKQVDVDSSHAGGGGGGGGGGGSVYKLFNTSRAAAPFLSFEIPRTASVLRAVYDASSSSSSSSICCCNCRARCVRRYNGQR